MKRVVTLIVVALMVLSLGSGIGIKTADAKLNAGRNAAFIATKIMPVGFNQSANTIYQDRTKEFELGGSYTGWGRPDYLMPHCTNSPATGAVRAVINYEKSLLYNIPGTAATSVEPRFWGMIYIIIDF